MLLLFAKPILIGYFLSIKLPCFFVDEAERRRKDTETTLALHQAMTFINVSDYYATTTGINSCNICPFFVQSAIGLLYILRSIACMQCIRCGLLLQMSRVAWSVCLSVCWLHGRNVEKRLDRSRCRLNWLTLVGPRNHCVSRRSRSDEFICGLL